MSIIPPMLKDLPPVPDDDEEELPMVKEMLEIVDAKALETVRMFAQKVPKRSTKKVTTAAQKKAKRKMKKKSKRKNR